MKVVTTTTVPNREIEESLGIVRGNTYKIKPYSKLFTRARDEAIERMEAHAESMGADAVIDVRFETSTIAKGGAEVIAYGTAVMLRQGVSE